MKTTESSVYIFKCRMNNYSKNPEIIEFSSMTLFNQYIRDFLKNKGFSEKLIYKAILDLSENRCFKAEQFLIELQIYPLIMD